MNLDDLIKQVEGDEPLDRLASAMGVKADLDELTDSLIGHFVDQARRAGHSWSEIGTAMGMTKQAAQQRHTTERPPRRMGRLFARFTPRARAAVREAEDAARELRHPYLDTEHLLLGLLAVSQGLAAKSLAGAGVTREAVLASLERGEHDPERGRRRHVPFTPAAKGVLEGAFAEALQLAHNYIGTEHILIALLREPDGQAARILAERGVTAERVQADILERLKTMS